MPPRLAALAGLSAFAAVLAVCGCSTAVSPAFSPAPRAAAVGNSEISELTGAMAERDRALESLQTGAVMEYSDRDQQVKAREEIVVQRPNSLRVEAMSPFGVALIVAAQDTHLQIFEPSKNTLMRGTADAATLARFARIPMAPRDAVCLLMGIVPEARNASAPNSATSDGDLILLAYERPDHSRRELGFSNGLLTMVRERGAGGGVNYEIRYADYHDIGGLMFAYQVDAQFPPVGTRVKFRYQRPIVNGRIPDSAFVLTPAPGTTQLDIGMRIATRAALDG